MREDPPMYLESLEKKFWCLEKTKIHGKVQAPRKSYDVNLHGKVEVLKIESSNLYERKWAK